MIINKNIRTNVAALVLATNALSGLSAHIYTCTGNAVAGSVTDWGISTTKATIPISKRGADLAVGVDVTSAVDAAQESFKERDNVFFIQADIFNPPIKRNYFDFGYSIGVLHHTPNPEFAFGILASLLNNKGQIGVSLYEIALFERPNRNSLKQCTIELLWAINLWRVEFFRLFTTRMPRKVMIIYCL